MQFPLPARYFPVKREALRMQAGLMKFGTDFGNGERDNLFFQFDHERERYRAAKKGHGGILCRDDRDARIHDAVLAWLRHTLTAEHQLSFDAGADARVRYEEVARSVQEDLVVLRRNETSDEAVFVHVSFPSGWRPEALLGASFLQIHAPVPRFAKTAEVASSMLSAMMDRGPYVRFVWTLSADDHLDHHPQHGCRLDWDTDSTGYLRLERQITIPFQDVEASLFLIRTYVYPFDSLSADELETLRAALLAMPEEIKQYKRLTRVSEILGALERARPITRG